MGLSHPCLRLRRSVGCPDSTGPPDPVSKLLGSVRDRARTVFLRTCAQVSNLAGSEFLSIIYLSNHLFFYILLFLCLSLYICKVSVYTSFIVGILLYLSFYLSSYLIIYLSISFYFCVYLSISVSFCLYIISSLYLHYIIVNQNQSRLMSDNYGYNNNNIILLYQSFYLSKQLNNYLLFI